MRGLRGFLTGFFGLVVLGALVSAEQRRAGRVSGLLDVFGKGLTALKDPNRPAIADRRATAGIPAGQGKAVGAQIAQVPRAVFGPGGIASPSSNSRRRVPGQAQP